MLLLLGTGVVGALSNVLSFHMGSTLICGYCAVFGAGSLDSNSQPPAG